VVRSSSNRSQVSRGHPLPRFHNLSFCECLPPSQSLMLSTKNLQNAKDLNLPLDRVPASQQHFSAAGVPGGSGRVFTSTTPSLIRTR
jgi:hypothetical protein